MSPGDSYPSTSRRTRRFTPGSAPGPASLQDRDGAVQITGALREAFSTIELVWADGGYAGRFVTDAKKIWNLVIAVVTRPATARGFVLLRRRWVTERTLGSLVKHRRLVRDHETLPETHEP